MKTTMRRGITSVCLAALFVTTSVAVANVQSRPHFGVHAGYNADGDAGLLGLQVSVPLVEQLEFYPSFNVYFPNRGTQLGFNADLKYRALTSSSLWLYGGGGLGVQ